MTPYEVRTHIESCVGTISHYPRDEVEFRGWTCPVDPSFRHEQPYRVREARAITDKRKRESHRLTLSSSGDLHKDEEGSTEFSVLGALRNGPQLF